MTSPCTLCRTCAPLAPSREPWSCEPSHARDAWRPDARAPPVHALAGETAPVLLCVLAELEERGFEVPTAEWMSHAETLLPQPRGFGAHQLPRMASLAEIFGQPSPRKVVKRQVPSETSPEKNQPSVIAMLLAPKSHEVPYRCIYGSKGAVKLRGTSSGSCGATTRTCAVNV